MKVILRTATAFPKSKVNLFTSNEDDESSFVYNFVAEKNVQSKHRGRKTVVREILQIFTESVFVVYSKCLVKRLRGLRIFKQY
jgi:hypothetical protein